MLKEDILRTFILIKGSKLKKIIGCYRSPGVHAVAVLRFGQWLLKQNLIFRIILIPIYIFLSYRIKSNWGIKISRHASIGKGFYIGHFGAIIIAADTVIGKNCNISQDVTIGISGQGENRGCPIIGDEVYIAPGAKVFGKIKIGNNVKIGANTVIYKDVPDNSIVVLDPGFKVISR